MESHKLVAEFVQRSLKENLGIEIVLENMEWKSMLKKVRSGDFGMHRFGWCSSDHPYTVMQFLKSDSPHNSTVGKAKPLTA